jgi:DNA-binding NtrC family response regulator
VSFILFDLTSTLGREGNSNRGSYIFFVFKSQSAVMHLGSQTRKLLSEKRFDLVITDVRLPDGSGMDVFNFARESHPGQAVIIMTAYANIADAVALVRAGALDYLEKPFEMAGFLLKVRQFLEDAERNHDKAPLKGAVGEAEKTALISALAAHDWVIGQTATALGISRKNLWEKMRKYEIEKKGS